MKKFIIENILIENSNKDIKTGINYSLSDGLNIINGCNEAGKSSIMKFINEGLLRKKDVDTGKIFFKIIDDNSVQQYRADINKNQQKQLRLKLFDSNNQNISYDLIEQNVNEKYFEQGFYINLEDLMNSEKADKESLINTIKDPSGDKLKCILDEIKSNAKKLYGNNLKPTKEITNILNEIQQIEKEILTLSTKESEYNSIIQKIDEYDSEISDLKNKEKFLEIQQKLIETNEKLQQKENEYNQIYSDFNENLFNKREIYFEIIQNSGKYDNNIENIRKNKIRIEELNNKISENKSRLNIEYSVDLDKNQLDNFVINNSNIKLVNELIQKIKDFNNKYLENNNLINTYNDRLIELNNEINSLKTYLISNEKIKELKSIYSEINEGVQQYNYCLNEILKINKSNEYSIFQKSFTRRLIILFILVILSSVILLAFNPKNITFITISSLICLFSLVGIICLISDLKKYDKNSEIKNKKDYCNSILVKLKNTASLYDSDIVNYDESNILNRLEIIKQDISHNLANYDKTKEQIINKETLKNTNNDKLNNAIHLKSEIEFNINNISNQIQEIIKSDNITFNINISDYNNVIEIIKTLKQDLSDKYKLEEEQKIIISKNLEIINNFNNFITENSISIDISEDFSKNIKNLEDYNNKNINKKDKLDKLNFEIHSLKNSINDYNKKSLENNNNYNIMNNIDEELLQLQSSIKAKLDEKQRIEFNKLELEKIEGLTNLKIQRSIKLDEYRKKIQELFTYKLILSMADEAKRNFDKTQPDLINAEKYLSILTDGKYTKINLDLEEIENDDKSVIKKWDTLSRGTKEQLYFALRLGYASNYTLDKTTFTLNDKPSLPFIVDDAFVNFDLNRTKNALKCLTEFSKTNQVIYFTCRYDALKNIIDEKNFNLINI